MDIASSNLAGHTIVLQPEKGGEEGKRQDGVMTSHSTGEGGFHPAVDEIACKTRQDQTVRTIDPRFYLCIFTN